MRFVPALARTHPGYWRVSVSLFILHVLMAIDALLLGPTVPFHFALVHVAPLWVFGVAHVVCAAVFIAGLYGGRFYLARLSFWISLSIFGLSAVIAAWGMFTTGVSLTILGLLLHALLTDAAAAIEPEEVDKYGR